MPFGLKNVGTTYQRLMDRLFWEQRGRNIEVYVDDILIKSLTKDTLVADIEETFGTLRRYRLKLNFEKCIFDVRSGRFLGYMVTERGIEANPAKVQALLDMKAPQNVREVQRLADRVTTLSRFISKVADRSLLFFKVLRKAGRFEWNEACDQAFAELKQYLAVLPALAKLVVRETLWVYLAATEGAVSSVLLRQGEGVQYPIYFISHLLKDAERCCTSLKRLTYAMVMIALRLHPYFLSHPIIVLTNSAMG